MHKYSVLHCQPFAEGQVKVCLRQNEVAAVTLSLDRPLDMDDITFGIIRELSSIPAALKAWRAIVAEILNDNRFFNSLPEAGEQFKPITKSFIDADKTAFPELLGMLTFPLLFLYSDLMAP